MLNVPFHCLQKGHYCSSVLLDFFNFNYLYVCVSEHMRAVGSCGQKRLLDPLEVIDWELLSEGAGNQTCVPWKKTKCS